MKRWILLGTVFSLFATGLAFGVEEPADKEEKDAPAKKGMFIGVDGCKKCHNGKMAEKGATKTSHAVWLESTHAKAFATLASEKAKEIGKKRGIPDPQKADACLKCHVTGHGVAADLLGKKYKAEDGVGCESCHGAGGEYSPMKVMKAITAKEKDGATVGLVKPTKETCLKCHNADSPTHKADEKFNFDEKVKKIKHPIMPEKKAS